MEPPGRKWGSQRNRCAARSEGCSRPERDRLLAGQDQQVSALRPLPDGPGHVTGRIALEAHRGVLGTEIELVPTGGSEDTQQRIMPPMHIEHPILHRQVERIMIALVLVAA